MYVCMYHVQSFGINCFSENDAIHSSSVIKTAIWFPKNCSRLTQLLLTFSEINEARCHLSILYKSLRFGAPGELLFKLWRIGITGLLWHWFKTYHNNPHCCVYINGSVSATLPVFFRVPQESILGPFLFIIYINDIPEVVSYSTPYCKDGKIHIYPTMTSYSCSKTWNHCNIGV